VPPRPALVPLTFRAGDRKRWSDLAGVSLEVIAGALNTKQRFRENMLFTHHGLSGPAILQISSYWMALPRFNSTSRPIALLAATCVRTVFGMSRHGESCSENPFRAASRSLARSSSLRGKFRSRFHGAEHKLHTWQIKIESTGGYGKAEVTAGGVDTSEISAKLWSRKQLQDYFLSEKWLT